MSQLPGRPASFYPHHSVLPGCSVESSQELVTISGNTFDLAQVIYLEGSGNYTIIHFENERRLMLATTLFKITALLPATLRVHKSFSISVGKISRVRRVRRKNQGYSLLITLVNGIRISVPRRRMAGVTDYLTLHTNWQINKR